MSKIIVTFEVPVELRDFIKKKSAILDQSMSGYLRNLVKADRAAWDKKAEKQWKKWQQEVDNIGVSNGN